jgi:chorismate--pyruvate lyase
MTAQNQQLFNAEIWETEPEVEGRQPNDVVGSWLTEAGLLTARMRAECDHEFRLEVVNDMNPAASQSELHRQVILWCGDQPCIYAQTSIPLATADAHPWLRELGDEPLGERLQSQPDVSRSLFVYTVVDSNQLPAKLVAADDAALWARRSDFYIGEDLLTVTEIFLPGVIHCGNQNNG